MIGYRVGFHNARFKLLVCRVASYWLVSVDCFCFLPDFSFCFLPDYSVCVLSFSDNTSGTLSRLFSSSLICISDFGSGWGHLLSGWERFCRDHFGQFRGRNWWGWLLDSLWSDGKGHTSKGRKSLRASHIHLFWKGKGSGQRLYLRFKATRIKIANAGSKVSRGLILLAVTHDSRMTSIFKIHSENIDVHKKHMSK